MSNTPLLLIILAISVLFIIIATSRLKIHPFIALILASYGVAIASGIPVLETGNLVAQGFGKIMASIGLIILFGTIIGVILEKSGAAFKISEIIMRTLGKKYPALSMTLIGYIVSIPVFCDSAYVILSSVRRGVAKKSGASSVVLSIALATGLYATHTLVPPTPGPVAAAGNLGMEHNLGLIMLLGLVVAAFAAAAGLLWALWRGQVKAQADSEEKESTEHPYTTKLPSGFMALLPIVLPIILIASSSLVTLLFRNQEPKGWVKMILFAGQPVNALILGILASLPLLPNLSGETLTGWIGKGITSAAGIIVITGAGGAFGHVLQEAGIGQQAGELLSGYRLGIWLPFLLAALMKTAQGSSTVALVTASAMVAPMLSSLGLDSEMGRALAVMATGAGAMTVSHANDSFFWVVTQFSGMSVNTGYKTMTTATLIQGVVSMLVIYLLSIFFL